MFGLGAYAKITITIVKERKRKREPEEEEEEEEDFKVVAGDGFESPTEKLSWTEQYLPRTGREVAGADVIPIGSAVGTYGDGIGIAGRELPPGDMRVFKEEIGSLGNVATAAVSASGVSGAQTGVHPPAGSSPLKNIDHGGGVAVLVPELLAVEPLAEAIRVVFVGPRAAREIVVADQVHHILITFIDPVPKFRGTIQNVIEVTLAGSSGAGIVLVEVERIEIGIEGRVHPGQVLGAPVGVIGEVLAVIGAVDPQGDAPLSKIAGTLHALCLGFRR
jgi:hypothetical protein